MAMVWSMTGQELTDRADRLAENSILKLVGRLSMAAVVPILLACMSWVATTLWGVNSEQVKLSGRIDVLSERVGQNLYRGSEAERDLKLRDVLINQLDRVVTDHGQRLYRLEQR